MSFHPEQQPSRPEFHFPPGMVPSPAPPMPPPRRQTSTLVILALVFGGALLFFIGIAVGLAFNGDRERPAPSSNDRSDADTTALIEARDICAPDSPDITIGDDGHTLLISRAGAEEAPGADISEVACIFAEIEIPDSVTSRIESTRALDGTQEAEFSDFSAFWTYHPDDGLNMTIMLEP